MSGSLSFDQFTQFKEKLLQIISNERNFVANAGNFASLVYHNLSSISWAGFYFVSNQHLILGPFMGKVPCVRIKITEGVCGASVRTKKPIIVPDVHKFPGYIPCDPTANSELVLPVFYQGNVVGVFDLDSQLYNRFTENDAKNLSSLLKYVIDYSNVRPFLDYYEITS
ncbi:MAG: GAF domain-containing protein [Ignavibacteria bacterium]|nr:GAF domain-containing protein [Ignavibacteria bacterium]